MDVNIIIPQYHTNHCINNCKYCGYNSYNKLMPRHRLSFTEFKIEFDLLLSWGYRTIEFVFSSDNNFCASEIARRIEYAKEHGIKKKLILRIGLNAEPFSYSDYKLLQSSGLDFFVVWMETYNQKKYKFWHGTKSTKSNFDYRFTSYDRAIEAGLKNYGMGVLLGLNNWQEDVNGLITHAKSITAKYGISPYIIGLPRYKIAHSVKLNGEITKVSDDEFSLICSIYKKNFPEAMLFFNTRENFNLNANCCNEGDLFTIDCGTYPGALINPESIKKGFEQFRTHNYDRKKTIIKLKEYKINPKFEW